jgi:hypothetical protein
MSGKNLGPEFVSNRKGEGQSDVGLLGKIRGEENVTKSDELGHRLCCHKPPPNPLDPALTLLFFQNRNGDCRHIR